MIDKSILPLISIANKDHYTRGVCSDKKNHKPIIYDNETIGFYTPHITKQGVYRTGPVYIKEEYRNKGIVLSVIRDFSIDKNCEAYIERCNIGAEKMFLKAGYIKKRRYSHGHVWHNSFALQSDITSSFNFYSPEIIYTDPPWGPGNLKYWRTMNKEKTVPSWDIFKDCLFTTCNQARNHVFIEMGMRWKDEIVTEIQKATTLKHAKTWIVTYGAKELPVSLNYFVQAKTKPTKIRDLNGFHGESYTWHSLKSVCKPGITVLDPCCGLGMTARFSMAMDMRFIGYELNSKRLSTTHKWINKASENKVKLREKWEEKFALS